MPYIQQYERDSGVESHPDNAGQLNYAFTLLAIEYIERHGLCYAHINDVMGAFEGAKLEFYRRLAAPYEDTKIDENGDVYDQGEQGTV